MKYYIINLERSKDRLNFMERQFKQLALDFIRVEAIDAKVFSKDF